MVGEKQLICQHRARLHLTWKNCSLSLNTAPGGRAGAWVFVNEASGEQKCLMEAFAAFGGAEMP